MPEVVYGSGNAPGLPPIDLPSLDPTQQPQPLRIEVTKTNVPQAPQAGAPVRPWTERVPEAAAANVPPVRPYKEPEAKTSEREIGGGEATLRGLAAGATMQFEPALVGAYQGAKTGLGFGETGKTAAQAYDEARQAELEQNQRAAAQHPYLYHGGEFGGALGTVMLPGVGLGRAATTLGRIAMSTVAGTTAGGITGAGEATSQGLSPSDVAINAAKGAGAGALLGGVGGAAFEGASAVGSRAASILRARRNLDQEAARVVGEAARGGASQRQIAERTADIPGRRAAHEAGTDTRLVDYLGAPGAARLRSAANINPEAREMAGQFVQTRYHQQSQRIANYLRSRNAGYDTEADREALTAAARRANASNYRRAEVAAERRFPNGINSPELQRLASGDVIPAAMQRAARSSRDRQILEGGGGLNSRVRIENGVLTFQNRRGVAGYPDLRFWDYAQRELQNMIGQAQRGGANEEAARLIGLRHQLVAELDRQVPEFQQARGVAARFFRVADASEAGERFVTDNSTNPAARRVVAQMSAPERELFARGFAARLSDMIDKAGDRANVLDSMFVTSNRARERIEIALGPQEAAEFEALKRVEAMVDRTRRAVVGNSTSAQQFHDMALSAGGGMAAAHGNIAVLVAAGLVWGARQAMHELDQRLAMRVAEMLLSDDPVVFQRALQVASRNPTLREALRAGSHATGREILNILGPSGTFAGAAAAAKHFNPLGSSAPPELPHQDSTDDQYDYDRAGGRVP